MICLLMLSAPGAQAQVRWAEEILEYSSEYSSTAYAAAEAVGKPNTPPGLQEPAPQAWSPLQADAGEEFIRLGFGEGLEAVQQIAIVESYHPGAIYRVYLESESRAWLIHEAIRTKSTEEDYRIYSIFLDPTANRITGIRIELKTDRAAGFNHLDAAGISQSRDPIEPEILLADLNIPGSREELGPGINSDYSEVHQLVSPDGQRLYLTRKDHPGNIGAERKDDIWMAQLNSKGKWGKARNAGSPLNDKGHNYLNGISPDDNLALVAANYEHPNEREQLYLARRAEGVWLQPVPLDIPDLVNKNEYSAFHMASDNRTILVSVEREGGLGYKDLYVTFNAQGPQSVGWSSLLNLGPDINTLADETTPYLAPDGQTLYFTTTGRYGFGSSDLFVSKRLDDTWTHWSEPRNLGPKINSEGWDANFSLLASGEYAYFTSRNPKNGSEDIYRILLSPGDQIEQVLVVNGQVLDRQTLLPLKARVSYTLEDGEREMGEAFSELPDGHFQIVLPGGQSYACLASAAGYYALNSKLDLRELPEYGEVVQNILMAPIRAGEVIPLPDVSFEINAADLNASSYPELRRVARLLQDHPGMTIEVSGHTNDRCDQLYCRELSEKRARAVMAFLIEQGAASDRIIAIGYGKEKPLQDNSTEAGRSANQRVEFKILKTNP